MALKRHFWGWAALQKGFRFGWQKGKKAAGCIDGEGERDRDRERETERGTCSGGFFFQFNFRGQYKYLIITMIRQASTACLLQLKKLSKKLPKHGGQAEARRSSLLGKLRDDACDIMGRRLFYGARLTASWFHRSRTGQDQPWLCLPAVCISGALLDLRKKHVRRGMERQIPQYGAVPIHSCVI